MNPATEPKKRIKEGFIGQKLIVLPPNIKRNIARNPLIKSFYLTAIGHYPKASLHGIERKTGCNEYILIYCIEGKGDISISNVQYNIDPNTYLIIPRNVPHKYRSSTSNPWSIYWVHFSGDLAQFIYNRSLLNDQPHVYTVPYDENRIKQFQQICYILEHSYNEKEMEILNIHLLHFISSLIYYKEINPALYDNDIVSQSIAYMKKNIAMKFTIEDLALQQRISISHYSRIFKHKTGASPINYFNQLKIQKSCQYLYFTDSNIKEICALLGFDDPYYFSRLFTKLMGVSPSAYKKKHKK
ncbi:AraC-like DNA-binding protein [Arcticibacter tournemirensis]|uniref:AraC family transcriptional regulator n=1 Tax=Arcticibacter tournemirensis TaxID=699437 RepID=A0A4Q0MDM9_9SPHI|nr:AraC family transcriptional regulator [Arcticibacter tournemirensis]KAA8481917.1 AraC family transcriptional regulator [Arcticibacter tournemirensis]RXF71223.1 AraC family transcriptional regulator [Arcticibacter tournemirensis]TQM52251.1 AraC-like DNA-binding protein [Arcticibacter tournemirensis]